MKTAKIAKKTEIREDMLHQMSTNAILRSAKRAFSTSEKQTVLVLGAGLVSRPCVEYLSRQHRVNIVSGVEGEANSLAASLPQDRAISTSTVDVQANMAKIEEMVQAADLTISLLPAPMHPDIARMCLAHGKNMVTASYVSDDMRSLDAAFKKADLICLNEVGVDPGMDHMSAQKVIDEVEAKGGKVVTFSSVCGGLPAPEAANNLLKYKFSWSPRGVITAAKNNARYKKQGQVVEIASADLLGSSQPVTNAPWENLELEHLPNRDSCAYEDVYRLKDAHSVYRGTLRFRGWCSIMNGFGRLGLLDDTARAELQGGGKMKWAELMGGLLGVKDEAAAVQVLEARGVEAGEAQAAARCAAWLGCWSDGVVQSEGVDNVMDVFCHLLTSNEELWFEEGERDMIVMHHEFGVEWPEGVEGSSTLTSSLLCYGEVEDSAMAKTVGLTTGIAASIVMDGNLTSRGVLTPVVPEIYLPGLERLEAEGLRFEEN